MRRLWWCNADFDLVLAHRGGKMPARILEAARGMALHFWPAAMPDDALLVPPGTVPDGFAEALESLGASPPRFVTVPDPASAFTPFGWNEDAIRLNVDFHAPAPHPEPAVVRRVNSRAFSLELEHRLFPDDAEGAVFCPDPDALRSWLARAPRGRYVAKGNHGHAGIGQIRFAVGSGDGAPLPVASLRRLAARHDGAVVEPLLDVAAEWGVLFDLRRDGSTTAPRRHRLLTGPTGGFAGALAGDAVDDPDWMPHADAAEIALRNVASALHEAGYFGPVGLDMLGVRHEGVIRLRPVCDLNARHSMARPVHGLAARFPGRAVLFRQYPAGRLPRNTGLGHVRGISDTLSFDSGARRGMIGISPLLDFSRASVAFVGRDAEDIQVLQREFKFRCNP